MNEEKDEELFKKLKRNLKRSRGVNENLLAFSFVVLEV